MAKTNTERMTSHVWRTTMHTWTLAAAFGAIAANATSLLEDYDGILSLGMFGIGISIFLLIFVLGVVAAFIRSGNMKKSIQTLEQNAEMTFDADTLEPVTNEKNLLLGKEWMVINAGHTAKAFPKGAVASADSIMPRKEGMKKVWARIHDKTGKQYACMYRAAEPDGLKRVTDWLGTTGAEPARSTPQPEPVPEGTCPFCTGPNEPGSAVCQWCGSKLEPATVKSGFSEPAEAASPIPASVSQEPGKNRTGTYIVIALLVIALAALLYKYYL